ncbi:MAG: FAD-binding oxidoreductase [bacterium]|nr:FAD-binding oxidoreductase [bacterium]
MSASLTAGEPFWLVKNGLPESYLELNESIEVDVVILGVGITGALIAHSFAKAGLKVALIDKRRIAHGSTAASTALLQYEIDTPLSELKNQIGKESAERAYHLCGEAIEKVGEVARSYPHGCSYMKRPSLYIASAPQDIKFLKEEFNARKEAGFEVSWIEEDQLKSEYKIHAVAAIRSELGAQVDPYILVHSILGELKKDGHFIFERTEIDTNKIITGDGVVVTSMKGYTVKAKKLIFATGYESEAFIKEKIVKLKSSYAFVTEKIAEKEIWKDNVLIWDTAKPYIYARTTEDNRILIGGGDIATRNMHIRDFLIKRKAKKLLRDFKKYMPRNDLKIAFQWTGTFGETEDGLAYIGELPEWKNCYFALGFGGNGITYSALAGDFMVKLFKGEYPKDLELFRFGRNK